MITIFLGWQTIDECRPVDGTKLATAGLGWRFVIYSISHFLFCFSLSPCLAERCSALPSITGGTFSRSDQNNFQSIATLACQTGYKLTDSLPTETTCQANGDWTTPFPNCEGKFSLWVVIRGWEIFGTTPRSRPGTNGSHQMSELAYRSLVA